jgi:hypothetical protein
LLAHWTHAEDDVEVLTNAADE